MSNVTSPKATMTSDVAAVRDVRAFIFDMDGVIYRGNNVLAGAPEFLAALRATNIPYLYLTNNSTTPRNAVVERIGRMGIRATPDQIMTSAEATAASLANAQPGCRVLVIGEQGVREALLAAKLSVTERHEDADAVVVGLDREVTYARLKEAALALQRGALFLATNTDASLPAEEGLIPGAGSLVGMLEIATGRKARAIGKPSPEIFRIALSRLGTPVEVTAVVGDRPETDILGGQLAGLKTIGLLCGVGTAEQFSTMQAPPDWVFEDLAELARAYFRR
jgi:HAD superfamily hydrolase (TIGR01457 family)